MKKIIDVTKLSYWPRMQQFFAQDALKRTQQSLTRLNLPENIASKVENDYKTPLVGLTVYEVDNPNFRGYAQPAPVDLYPGLNLVIPTDLPYIELSNGWNDTTLAHELHHITRSNLANNLYGYNNSVPVSRGLTPKREYVDVVEKPMYTQEERNTMAPLEWDTKQIKGGLNPEAEIAATATAWRWDLYNKFWEDNGRAPTIEELNTLIDESPIDWKSLSYSKQIGSRIQKRTNRDFLASSGIPSATFREEGLKKLVPAFKEVAKVVGAMGAVGLIPKKNDNTTR